MSHTNQSTTNTPTLSVVIPVYNDPEGIRTTIESLTAQTYPVESYEVLVVDNGSDDDTREVIGEYYERYPELVTLLVEDEIQSSYAARNRGIEHARGSLVSFIDADMSVEGRWSESVVASHVEHGWDYMGCSIELYADGPESLAGRYNRVTEFPVEEYLRDYQFSVTACLTVTRAVLDDVGGFDPRLVSGGDAEFGRRVHAAGFEQYFESDITMFHPARATVRALLGKQFRIGRGAVQRRRYYPEREGDTDPYSLRTFLPLRPLYFYTRLTDRIEPTLRETVAFYGFEYLGNLARAAGGLYEQYCVTASE